MFVCFICGMSADTRTDLNSTLHNLLENIRDEKIFDSFLKFIAVMLIPLKKCGFLGIFLFPLFLIPMLPLGLIVLSILIFPMVNLTVRLLLLIVLIVSAEFPCSCVGIPDVLNTNLYQIIKLKVSNWSKKGKIKYMRSRVQLKYAITLASSLVAIGVSIIFIVESLVFYAECTIYLLIGIILNSDDTLNFFILILSVAIYTYQCFSAVGSKYQAFGKLLTKIFFNRLKTDVTATAEKKKEDQSETAFALPPRHKDKDDIKLTLTYSGNSYLKWTAKRLFLFLDTDDIVHISRNFLMKVADLDHAFCPGHEGPVHIQYINAIIKLFWITLYLTFQFVVIAAFGRKTNSSSFNQTMATIAGGFLPYIVIKYFKKKNKQPSLERKNIAFKFKLEEIIEKFEESWHLVHFVSDNMNFMKENVNINTDKDDIDLIVKHEKNEKWIFWVNEKSNKNTPNPNLNIQDEIHGQKKKRKKKKKTIK